MSLPVKITALIFAIVVVFLTLHSWFLYRQINENFRAQAEQQMLLCTTLLQDRLDNLKDNLKTEIHHLATSLFTENEGVLAAMLAIDPDYNTEVVHFAESLRRRTTLQYLTVLSADGTVLSSSEQPAIFGTQDPHPQFPMSTAAYLLEGQDTRLEWKEAASFGNRSLLLRGGYSLKPELERFAVSGLRVLISRPSESPADAGLQPSASASFRREITISDYRESPLLKVTFVFDARELIAQRQAVIKNSIILVSISLLVCLLAGHILSRWISRPLSQLTDAALLMSVGQREVRVPQDAGGEVGELLTAFNRMAEQIEEQQQKLVSAERVAAWQEIAQHLAHEIKNPLTPIRTSITNLRLSREKAPEKFGEIFLESSESILQEVDKLRRLADEFARFARLPAPELRTGNLNEVIQKCVVLHRDQPGITVEFLPGDLPQFDFDSNQISEVMHNLLRNACEALPDGGTVRVTTGTAGSAPDQRVQLIVEDNGVGMTDDVRHRIFTPYFTTRESGTGLGLAIVHRIVTQHRGRIVVSSAPQKGTRFEIDLPLREL